MRLSVRIGLISDNRTYKPSLVGCDDQSTIPHMGSDSVPEGTNTHTHLGGLVGDYWIVVFKMVRKPEMYTCIGRGSFKLYLHLSPANVSLSTPVSKAGDLTPTNGYVG